MDVMDTNTWAEANARYLTAALSWLRLRLERLAQRIHPSATPIHNEPEPPQRHSFWHLSEPAPSKPTPKSQSATLDEQLEQYAREMSAAEAREEKPALVLLSKRLGLSTFERNVLLLCVGMELDTRIAGLCARAQDDLNKPYPTFALALVLFEELSWDVVSPERPLRYWRLLEINQPNGQSLITSSLRADERAVSYVKGLEYLDDRLASLVVPLEIDGEHEKLPYSQEELVESITHAWQRAQSTLPLIQLVGPDTLSKQLVAYHVATKLRRHIYRMPLEMVPQQPVDVETLARLWHRESLLLPIALYLDAQEGDGTPGEGQAHSLSRFLARSDGYFFLGTRETESRVGRSYVTVDVTKPTPAEQQEAWREALGNEAPDSAALLAGQFNLNLTTIHRIAADALEDTEYDRRALPDRLSNACLKSTRPRLDMLAQRLELKATWDDLVLPDEETKILHQIADQVGQRSKVYDEWGFASKMNRVL